MPERSFAPHWRAHLSLGWLVVPVLLCLLVVEACIGSAKAGELSREDLAAKFSPPFAVGERDAALPVYPVFRTEGTQDRLVAYVFESADLQPIPGFSGTPPNLLIILNVDGSLERVAVISQHEPVFVDGLGQAPLEAFVEQYAGKTLAQNVKVGPPRGETGRRPGSTNSVIDGVAKATASVRIINESVLAAALDVARAKLGASGPAKPAARPRPSAEPMTFAAMEAAGLVDHVILRERDVEAAFRGSEVEGLDTAALAHPDDVFADIRIAYLNIPTVGEGLLGKARWDHLVERLDATHVLYVSVGGRWQPFGDGYVHGSTPDMFALTQGGLALDLRDLEYEHPFALADAPVAPFALLRVFGNAGFDPASPFRLSIRLTRDKGQIFPVRVVRDFPIDITLPARWFEAAASGDAATGWRAIWLDRLPDLAVLGAGLAGLAALLALQPRSMRYPRLFKVFRTAFMVFCLVVIGWRFQAQLSIVTLAGVLKAASGSHDLSFLMWDPPSLVLWGVVLVTAPIWGRGTFCGWLCPFGALQELLEQAARPLRLPQWRIPQALDRRLRGAKYAVLAGFVAICLFAPARAETVAEVEPFKTAITLAFARAWPAVAYVLLLAANLFVYKAFCRYLCPLGAFLAILGRLRRFDWIKRRAACGSPCRLCERKCRYGAISRAGVVDYDECFQCMDCVVIHQDKHTCVPLVLAARAAARRKAAVP